MVMCIDNGQNKVAEVRQNGKTIARFEYNIDGQIAKAIYGDKVEEFMWDGLALIWRSGVTYINEPYVTGGNPVMAGDDVLFNDMLGSTLAVNGNPVEMTSFGETADKNAFFTGKPMIDGLGYSFLFRDYNPSQGKWTTSDPLGYPDGWNNLAYLNNKSNLHIDSLGLCRTEYQIVSVGPGVTKTIEVTVHDVDTEKSPNVEHYIQRGALYNTLTSVCGGGTVSLTTGSQTIGFSAYGFSWSATTATLSYQLDYSCGLDNENQPHSERGTKTVDYYWTSDYTKTTTYYKCGAENVTYAGSSKAYLTPVLRENSLTQCKE